MFKLKILNTWTWQALYILQTSSFSSGNSVTYFHSILNSIPSYCKQPLGSMFGILGFCSLPRPQALISILLVLHLDLFGYSVSYVWVQKVLYLLNAWIPSYFIVDVYRTGLLTLCGTIWQHALRHSGTCTQPEDAFDYGIWICNGRNTFCQYVRWFIAFWYSPICTTVMPQKININVTRVIIHFYIYIWIL